MHYGRVSRRYIDGLWLTVEVAELDGALKGAVEASLNWCAAASAVLFDNHPLLVRARRMLWKL
jgi:hypothetical protein